MENDKLKNYEELKRSAVELGAAAFGVCDIKNEKKDFILADEATKDLDYAISIAVTLSKSVLKDITDHPNRLYFHNYRQTNSILDQIATKISNVIQNKGFNALPIPASQIVDWEKQTAHLSHKKMAQLAGIGWLGRSNLIVHPKHGSAIRLVTILTDMPLKIDDKLKDGCGACMACLSACPAAAIKEDQKSFDHQVCFEKLKEFQRKRYVDQFICGVCIKACVGKNKA